MDQQSLRRHVLVAILALSFVFAEAPVRTAPVSAAPGAGERVESAGGVAKKRGKKSRRKRGRKKEPTLGKRDYYVYDHLIVRGDTVGKLARKYGVTQDQILVWNDLLSPHLIRAGNTLVIYSKKRFRQYERAHHTVRKGETLGKIARRYKMRLSQIRALNRIRGDLIHPGQSLVVLKPKKPEIAHLGGRGKGKLRNAVQLTSGAGYHVRNTRESWGTLGTVRQLKRAFRLMRKKYRKSVIAVGDLSKKRGGPLAGHRSHQRGLDVDLSFYRKGQTVHERFQRESPRTLDAKRTWAILDILLDGGQIDMIFIDYALQKPLYQEAKRRGMSRARLTEVFQYPRGKRARRGIIRHEPGHDDHIHVRFLDMPTRSTRRERQGRTTGAAK